MENDNLPIFCRFSQGTISVDFDSRRISGIPDITGKGTDIGLKKLESQYFDITANSKSFLNPSFVRKIFGRKNYHGLKGNLRNFHRQNIPLVGFHFRNSQV